MLDWTAAGTMDPSRDRLDFGLRKILNLVGAYTIGFFLRLTRGSVGGGIIMETNQLIQWGGVGNGWVIKINGSSQLLVNQNQTNSAVSPGIPLDTTYSYLVVWDSTNGLQIYRNASSWHSDATFTGTPAVADGIHLCVGSDPAGLITGPPGQVGNIAIWPGLAMDSRDAEMWHAGIMPHRDSVRFFYRGTEIPGKDEYEREIPDAYRHESIGGSGSPSRLPFLFQSGVSLYTNNPSNQHFEHHGSSSNFLSASGGFPSSGTARGSLR